MENKQQQEPEVEKNEESKATPPVMQSEDKAEPLSANKLQDDLTESKDKYLRLYAEFDNFRRRTVKEKIEVIQLANESLISNLLPVLDDFARAEKSFQAKNDKESEGFFLIQNKFKKILESSGVKAMEVGSGSVFDPELHEAITQIPAAEERLKGKIVDVVENGYFLNDKVIRHAKVVIGS